jgi:hypothetical protein
MRRCVGAGDRCNDTEFCSVDSCDEAMDRCNNVAMADETACSATGGAMGLCRAGRCCSGCWDGTGARCQGGTTAAFCGVRGGLCASCVDGVSCSSDVCTAGTCSNPDAPSGTSCDDALFCTTTDTCDGRRTCVGGGAPRCNDMTACTVDTCDEVMDRCDFATTMDVCNIGGVCVADGAVHTIYTCLVCDPSRDATDWSPRGVGEECRAASCAAGRLLAASTCDAMGTCVAGTSTRCPTGACADATGCEMACDAGSCPSDEYCDATTGSCEPTRDAGERCTDAAQCASGSCTDGRCCDAACDGICVACDLAGMLGACAPHAAGTDPDMECGAGGCDGAGGCRMGGPDAGPRDDGGPIDPDAGMPGADAGDADGATGTPDAGRPGRTSGNGCGCATPGARDGGTAILLAPALLGVTLLGRRRRQFR